MKCCIPRYRLRLLFAMHLVAAIVCLFARDVYRNHRQEQLLEEFRRMGANIIIHERGIYITFGGLEPPCSDRGTQRKLSTDSSHVTATFSDLKRLEHIDRLRFVDLTGTNLDLRDKSTLKKYLRAKCFVRLGPMLDD